MDIAAELLKLGNRQQHVWGQTIQQSWAALFVYEWLLHKERARIHWIVEVGTGYGTLTMWLGLWAHLLNVPCLTIDNGAAAWAGWQPTRAVYTVLSLLDVTVVERSCFDPETIQAIKETTEGQTGLLFCDGGNKVKEVTVLSPLVAKGSIVIAHDWPIEIDDRRVSHIQTVRYLQPYHDASLKAQTKSAIMEVC